MLVNLDFSIKSKNKNTAKKYTLEATSGKVYLYPVRRAASFAAA